jgi:hypothetical protein
VLSKSEIGKDDICEALFADSLFRACNNCLNFLALSNYIFSMKTISKKRLEDFLFERIGGVLKEVETERKLQGMGSYNILSSICEFCV